MAQDQYPTEPSLMALDQAEFIKTRRGEFHIVLHFRDQDRIGCLLDEIEVKPTNDTRLLLDPFLAANTLSHLDGGMVVVEDQGPGQRAVLRSALQETIGSSVHFFEIVIDARDGLVLRRHVHDRSSGKRGIVPFSMTRETLDRLVSDLKKLLRG